MNMKKNQRARMAVRQRFSAIPVLVLVMACLLTAACCLLDELETRNGWRQDYSFNHITTWSDATREAVSQLPYPVHIYVLASGSEEDAPLMELLARYTAASDLIQVESVDPSLNPGLLTRFSTEGTGIASDSVIVSCETTDRYRVLSAEDFVNYGFDMDQGIYQIEGLSYENALTNAIVDVTRDDIPRIVIIQGHGELDEAGTAVLADLLSRNHYEVVYSSLQSSQLTLEADDVVFLLSPVLDLLDQEAETLRQFLNAGGRILFTCDYTDPIHDMPHVQELMRYFGFHPMDGIVIASAEEPDSCYDGRQLFLIPNMYTSALTESMVEARETTLILAGARAFEMPEENDRDLSVELVLSSTARAYLRSLDGDLSTLDQLEGDQMGPFALCLTGERMTEAGELTKGMILGCSTVLTSAELYAMTDAQSLILNACRYLSGREVSAVAIPARNAMRPMLSARGHLLGWLILAAVPLTVTVTALLVLVPRNRRVQESQRQRTSGTTRDT